MTRLFRSAAFRFIVVFSFLSIFGYSLSASAQGDQIWRDSAGQRKPYMDPGFNRAMTELVKNSLPAVVSIVVEASVGIPGMAEGDPMNRFFDFFFNQPYHRKFKQHGMGSGFIINENGFVLTNNHVIENADDIKVKLHNGDEYEAKVIGADSRTDLALLKIEAGDALPYLPLGNSDDLDVGHMVIAMGNPLGLDHTVTQGIVSQKGRKDITPSGRKILANFIQTDASINPGNSGGPLLNIYGEVIGINTAIAQGQGIGFAIPVNMAKTLLPQLAVGKIERSWIGVQVQQLTPELAESLGLEKPRGALVSAVMEDSPASKAGLQEADVILEVDGQGVDSQADLVWMVSTAGVGTKITLTVWRDRKERKVKLTLASLPEKLADWDKQPRQERGVEKAFGLVLGDPEPERLKKLEITDGKGALVIKIDPQSEAARAGVRPGDVIRKINNTLVKDAAHLAKIAEKLGKGKTVRLFINRERQALFVAFKLNE